MEKVKNQVGFKGSLEEFLNHVKTDPKAMPYQTSKEVLAGFQSILDKITPKLKTMFNVTRKVLSKFVKPKNTVKQVQVQNTYREVRMENVRDFTYRFPTRKSSM
jgi:hypothetical protein